MSRGPDAARRAETKNLLRRLLLLSILIATKNHKAQARDPIGRQRCNIIFFFSFLKSLFGVSSCGFFLVLVTNLLESIKSKVLLPRASYTLNESL